MARKVLALCLLPPGAYFLYLAITAFRMSRDTPGPDNLGLGISGVCFLIAFIAFGLAFVIFPKS